MGKSQYEVAAYYFPNWHVDPQNELWYGPGWTEWNLVQAAKPRYPGHAQPKVPAWGYFDESDPAWASREITLAREHGVTAFIYDWYWYHNKPYLQGGLEHGFLQAPNHRTMKFALMWANHTWVNIHPAQFNNHPEGLARGELSKNQWESATDYIVQNYFSRQNYLRLDGRLYFSIYELATLINGLGGLSATQDALNSLRKKVSRAGLGELHLNAILWGVQILPAEVKLDHAGAVVEFLGFNSTTTYAWVHHYNPNEHGFPRGSYAQAMAANFAQWRKSRLDLPIPYYPNVSMGWDPSPRTVQTSPYANRGYPWTAVLEGNTPAAFRQALHHAKEFLDGSPTAAKFLTLNAWNEWTEGSYLLPDTVHGTAYLQAIRDVFG